jgi:hypothetical protein
VTLYGPRVVPGVSGISFRLGRHDGGRQERSGIVATGYPSTSLF